MFAQILPRFLKSFALMVCLLLRYLLVMRKVMYW